MRFSFYFTIFLQKICLWITQNIIAAGIKPMNILMSQELLKNCLHVLNNAVDQEEEAIQLLELIIEAKWSEIEVEHKTEIEKSAWNLLKKNFDDPMVLQVFLKVVTLGGAWNFNQEQNDQLVIMMTMNLMGEIATESNEKVLPFALKLLSMSFQHNHQNVIKSLEVLVQNNVKLSEIINKCVASPKHFGLIAQLVQFTAALYVDPDPIVVQYFANDSPENWKIPKIFTF